MSSEVTPQEVEQRQIVGPLSSNGSDQHNNSQGQAKPQQNHMQMMFKRAQTTTAGGGLRNQSPRINSGGNNVLNLSGGRAMQPPQHDTSLAVSNRAQGQKPPVAMGKKVTKESAITRAFKSEI